MATASKCDKSTHRLKFLGPAGSEDYETFEELSIFSLDTYWPNWRKYKQPASYIIPPMFTFKEPEKSDFEYRETEKDYQKLKIENDLEYQKMEGEHQKFKSTGKTQNLQPPALVTTRKGELGEYIVYEAITRCLRDEKFAPFLAIQGLEVNDKLKRHFPQLFPEFGADILKETQGVTREHDFILIGPSIGILCIEVKSGTFSGQNDFSPKSNYLPDDIKSGIKQLNSFEKFLASICHSQGIDCLPVKKFLFTPHLEKNRFDKWMDNLNSEAKKSVLKKIENIKIWFGNQPPNSIDLYPTMIKVLKSKNRISNGHYEKLGNLMAGLASVLVIKNNISLEISKLSEKEAIDGAGRLLDKLGKRQNVSDSQAMILTEDQNKAMKGPNRQFILGTAGTGKTVVLRAMAQKLLNDGKSVVVLVSRNELYGRKNFSFGGYQKCEILKWLELFVFVLHDVYPDMINILKAAFYNANIGDLEPCNTIDLSPWIEKASLEKAKAWYDRQFSNFDAILIDDSLDDLAYIETDVVRHSLCCSLFIQVLSRIFSPTKIVWIAMDPSWISDSDKCAELLNYITKSNTNKSIQYKGLFGTVILKRVMRCSEKVFNEAYYPIFYRMKDKPLLGHKIPGSLELKEVVFHVESSADLVSEGIKAFHSVSTAFEKLLQDGYHQDQIVIICGKCVDTFLPFAIDSLKKYLKGGRYSHVDITDSVVLEWNKVSSMEWPVVIYVSLIEWADRFDKTVLYERYRACSRAQVKLIVIKGYFEHCKTSNEADIHLDHQIVKEADVPVYRESQDRYVCIMMNRKGKEYRQLANMAATAETLMYYHWVRGQDVDDLAKVARRRCHTIHAFNLNTFKVSSVEFRMHRKFLDASVRDSLDLCFIQMVKQSQNDRDKTKLPTNVETGQIINDTAKKLPNHLKDIFVSAIENILQNSVLKKEPQLVDIAVTDETLAKLDRISPTDRIVNILNSLSEATAMVYRRAIIRYCRILSRDT